MMKTMKITMMLSAFVFINFQLKAQDTTKPFYFPHHKGDMWEYFYDDYSPMYVDTLQNFTIFDSIEFSGVIFMKQHAQFINPAAPPAVLEDSANYWIDTVNNYVWGSKGQSDSSLIYKLKAKEGEQWMIFVNNGPPGSLKYNIARITKKWKDTLFGKYTTFMNIYYYEAQDSTDTTGYSVDGNDVIADGFGLISRSGGELLGEIHLIGAVINDTLYGDTTVTSIKNKKIEQPTSIELYQNYPNPFNPSTVISWQLAVSSFITLKIYDILSREITTLVNDYESQGNHKIEFDSRKYNLSSGVYFYRLRAGKYISTKKMILLK